MVLAADNRYHFAADSVTAWLNGIGCRYLFAACSNNQAERFVGTLKLLLISLLRQHLMNWRE